MVRTGCFVNVWLLYDVAAAITHFVPVKVRGIDTPGWFRPFTDPWHGSTVAVFRMEMVIDISMKVFVAVKPWAHADEYSVVKPFRTVIAGGRTGVWSYVVITIRTSGRHTDTDTNLSLRCRGGGC
jgi:hypothetical protein